MSNVLHRCRDEGHDRCHYDEVKHDRLRVTARISTLRRIQSAHCLASRRCSSCDVVIKASREFAVTLQTIANLAETMMPTAPVVLQTNATHPLRKLFAADNSTVDGCLQRIRNRPRKPRDQPTAGPFATCNAEITVCWAARLGAKWNSFRCGAGVMGWIRLTRTTGRVEFGGSLKMRENAERLISIRLRFKIHQIPRRLQHVRIPMRKIFRMVLPGRLC